jgi:hypothetical protein
MKEYRPIDQKACDLVSTELLVLRSLRSLRSSHRATAAPRPCATRNGPRPRVAVAPGPGPADWARAGLASGRSALEHISTHVGSDRAQARVDAPRGKMWRASGSLLRIFGASISPSLRLSALSASTDGCESWLKRCLRWIEQSFCF